ncbi:type II toxin-antitoxin system mRNA interferase toxin, RelE/StbE family [Candidatus Daviesbacteria bacterium]|nr:type II toxin-antitoxin system mRNA interferase toxin, RelE/StbE family [Candidatus Daviesbacteria bacterium]
MIIRLGKRFKKAYKTRIASNKRLILQAKERIDLFRSDPQNPILKDHRLSGAKRELRAFSITGDIRLVY